MQTYLEKCQPAQKKMACFYPTAIMPKLFGKWTLYCEWGRIGQGGQVRMDWFEDENQAAAALVTLEASKRQRGYWVGFHPGESGEGLCFDEVGEIVIVPSGGFQAQPD